MTAGVGSDRASLRPESHYAVFVPGGVTHTQVRAVVQAASEDTHVKVLGSSSTTDPGNQVAC